MTKRAIAALAALAVCAIGIAVPAMAATAVRPTVAARAIPRGLLPMATSWPTPQRGIVLAYPSRSAGARPYLIITDDGGRTWRSLPAPPVAYPADNDQPDATFADGVIVVQDGTHIVVTRDDGRRWSAERLAGLSGHFYVDGVVVAHGRVFALVTSGTATAVYAGRANDDVLRAVRGLSVKGSQTYGDITATGALQVDLGRGHAAEWYWYSRDGLHFVAAPLPCPVATSALLGGVRAGKVIALCSGSASDIGLGQNDKRVWVAARLGDAFAPSGPVFASANGQGFAAASARDMTISTTFALYVTANGGRTWTAALIAPNGASFPDLSFPSAGTGAVVVNTVSNAGSEIGSVERTTDGGRVWRALALP